MMWTVIEIIAIVAESFLALAFNIGYFRMKSNDKCNRKARGY